MRRTPLLSFLLALTALGCRTNLLPEYHCKFSNAHTAVAMPGPARVALQTNNNSSAGPQPKKQGTSLLQVGANIGTWKAGSDAQEKLRRAMPAAEVQKLVQQVVDKEGPNLGFPFVDTDAKADTRLDVHVRDYGIFAPSQDSDPYAGFDMYISMTYLPEGKLIWEYFSYVRIALNDSIKFGGAAGALQNMSAVSNLSEENMKELFTGATLRASEEFMRTLSMEYRQAKGENKCQK